MIEQKDINRLLAGRKIVDDFRAVSEIYREKAAVSNAETATATDIAATKEQYGKREDAIRKMHEELYKLGFGEGADPSAYDAFFKYNKTLTLEAFKDCRPIKGTCNLCKGFDGVPPCKVFYKDAACINTFTPILDDRIWKISLDRYTGRTAYQACPKGHGFQPDTDNYKEIPFDLGWE